MNLRDQLRRDEGVRYVAYQDQFGFWTTSVGHKILLPQEEWMLTAVLTDEQVNEILDKDIAIAQAGCMRWDWFPEMDDARQGSIINMVFNLGLANFFQFHNTIACIADRNYEGARRNALQSDWAKQLFYDPANPLASRPGRVTQQLVSGVWT